MVKIMQELRVKTNSLRVKANRAISNYLETDIVSFRQTVSSMADSTLTIQGVFISILFVLTPMVEQKFIKLEDRNQTLKRNLELNKQKIHNLKLDKNISTNDAEELKKIAIALTTQDTELKEFDTALKEARTYQKSFTLDGLTLSIFVIMLSFIFKILIYKQEFITLLLFCFYNFITIAGFAAYLLSLTRNAM